MLDRKPTSDFVDFVATCQCQGHRLTIIAAPMNRDTINRISIESSKIIYIQVDKWHNPGIINTIHAYKIIYIKLFLKDNV